MERNEATYNWIIGHIGNGLTIQITTYYKSNLYNKKEDFKFNVHGVYVRRGKKWDCIYNNGIKLVDIRAIKY